MVQAGFFLTPIMYPPAVLPESLGGWLLLNPFNVLIELFLNPDLCQRRSRPRPDRGRDHPGGLTLAGRLDRV
ncbi:MAG: hypothetical protein IPM75_10405 [Candidatus Competibacteraceae bacterium]|nr:hypothetical protein [Candidatus Competibacteraceae bacterium]